MMNTVVIRHTPTDDIASSTLHEYWSKYIPNIIHEKSSLHFIIWGKNKVNYKSRETRVWYLHKSSLYPLHPQFLETALWSNKGHPLPTSFNVANPRYMFTSSWIVLKSVKSSLGSKIEQQSTLTLKSYLSCYYCNHWFLC